jgi:glycosyltransferase involved in cell wall biosynthesis
MKIALVTEGSYPFAKGGVAVWCDQLVTGLPDYRFEVAALTVDGTERPVFHTPRNLERVRSIPLWAASPYGDDPASRKRHLRPGGGFWAAYDAFLVAVLTPTQPGSEQAVANSKRFMRALRGLFEYASSGGNLFSALTTNRAIATMVDVWHDTRDPKTDGVLTLADALEATWLLEHMLRPIAVDPVRADIVHASMNGPSVLVGLAAKWRYETPLVVSEHGIYLRERYLSYLAEDASRTVKLMVLSFFRVLATAAYTVVDALAPHSNHNRRWQLRNGARPERMWTMYNGVTPEEFPIPTEMPPVPTVVYMGRIDPIKDLHTLIRAFSLVRSQVPRARLRIFGDVPKGNEGYRESCRRLIDELGLTGAATLDGRVADPVEAYHAGSVVALTSISEGFPYTVVEAMACGRPVVCTDVGGVAEAVGEAGVLVSPGDVVGVAQGCLELLVDHNRRHWLGESARLRVIEHFTLERWLDAYRRLYTGLASPAPDDEDAPHRLTLKARDQLAREVVA